MLDDWTNMMVFAREHDLIGNDILVFSALCVLCHNGPWELNYVELSSQSGCGSRTTAKRSCDTLLNKHLVAITNKMVYVLKSPFLDASAQNVQSGAQNVQLGAQNVQSSAQNVQLGAQNVQFSEKERTKEKEIINKNNFFFKKGDEKKKKVVLEKEFIPPSWEEVNTFALNSNIPIDLAKQWFHRWEVCHWQQDTYIPREWQMSLTGYFENAKKNPSLTHSSRQGGGEKPKTQQELDLEKIATDNAKEKVRKAKSEVFYEDHKPKPVEIDEHHVRLMKIVHQSMAHMALNPKK